MSDSPRLGLPLLEEAQAQKHLTVNEALWRLDAIVHLAVRDSTLISPPDPAVDYDRYVVAAGATGAWQGADHNVAVFEQGNWRFIKPLDGWICTDLATASVLIFKDGTWLPSSSSSGLRSDEPNYFTAAQSIAAGDSISDTPFFTLSPSDKGIGKPDLYFKKSATADEWQIGLWDNQDHHGTIGFFASNFMHNGSPVYTHANADALLKGIKVSRFSVSGTWTPHGKCAMAMIELVGGGGGGGGFRGSTGIGAGSSGGSGALCRRLLVGNEIPVQAAINVAAPGQGGAAGDSAGTGNSGGDGGETRYRDGNLTLLAPGGKGGGTSSSGSGFQIDGGPGAAIATGGDENYPGQMAGDCSGMASYLKSGGRMLLIGGGGTPMGGFGQGAQGRQIVTTNTDRFWPGAAVIGFGAGGGGAGTVGQGAATGGDGGGGYCKITEWVG